MKQSTLDEYMKILNDREDKPSKPIDLRKASAALSKHEEEADVSETSEVIVEKPKPKAEAVVVVKKEVIEPVEPEIPVEAVVKDIVKDEEDVDNDELDTEEDIDEEADAGENADLSEEEDNEDAGDPEFSLTDAFAIIAASVDEDAQEIDLESVRFALGYIESAIGKKLNALDPEYEEDVKLLGLKLNNYKIEYDKAMNMERRLYMIAMGETRLYRHIEKHGHDERTIEDITDIVEDWYSFIEDRTGFDMRENRDIGAILYTLQELKDEYPQPKTSTKKKKRRK